MNSPPLPDFAQRDTPLDLLIEGAGDVVDKFYLPAVQALLADLSSTRGLRATFVDDSRYWSGVPGLGDKMMRIIDRIQQAGATYLDKNVPAQLAEYEARRPEVVIIATPAFTHTAIAETWLERTVRPDQLFIEKPLDTSLDGARRLLGKVGFRDPNVLAYDHYRARMSLGIDQVKVLFEFLGRGIRQSTFYLLEDHSGADPAFAHVAPQRDGAIENEQRVKALNDGVLLDLMPHVLAVLAHLCRQETLRVVRTKVAQYIGVDNIRERRTDIQGETFGMVEWRCEDYEGNQVEGTAYVGKGVRGVLALGQEYNHNAKVLDLIGLNGNRARFDFRSEGQGASTCSLMDEQCSTRWVCQLSRAPYRTFLQKIANGTYLRDNIALEIEWGKRMLELLADIRYTVPSKKEDIPTYRSGMRNGEPGMYLEDILAEVPLSYGF